MNTNLPTFPRSRIIETFDDLTVMEHKLLVSAAANAQLIAQGLPDKMPTDIEELKLFPLLPHRVKMPVGGDGWAIIAEIKDFIPDGNNYEQVYEAARSLRKRLISVDTRLKSYDLSLFVQHELYKKVGKTGMFCYIIPDRLIADYVDLHRYFESFNGWAFRLKTRYQKHTYYWFSCRNRHGMYVRRDSDDRAYTDIDSFFTFLQIPPVYKDAKGNWLFGQVNHHILAPTFKWLAENTDLAIGELTEKDFKKEPAIGGFGRPRIKGFYTCAKTLEGRTAPAVQGAGLSYYQL